MKFLQLIVVSAVLLVSQPLIAQEPDSIEISYDIELIPTGTLSSGGDSLYQVTLIVDTVDVHQLLEVDLENTSTSSSLAIPVNEPTSNSRIKKEKRKYELDMYTFEDASRLKVKAKSRDGRKVKMIPGPSAGKQAQDIRPPRRRSLGLSTDSIVPEEEIQ